MDTPPLDMTPPISHVPTWDISERSSGIGTPQSGIIHLLPGENFELTLTTGYPTSQDTYAATMQRIMDDRLRELQQNSDSDFMRRRASANKEDLLEIFIPELQSLYFQDNADAEFEAIFKSSQNDKELIMALARHIGATDVLGLRKATVERGLSFAQDVAGLRELLEAAKHLPESDKWDAIRSIQLQSSQITARLKHEATSSGH
jgi:hypothetical protein